MLAYFDKYSQKECNCDIFAKEETNKINRKYKDNFAF